RHRRRLPRQGAGCNAARHPQRAPLALLLHPRRAAREHRRSSRCGTRPRDIGVRLARIRQCGVQGATESISQDGERGGGECGRGARERPQVAQGQVGGRHVPRTSPWLVFGLPAMLCAAWAVHAGKDVNWDQLNYHYYLPFELVAGRLTQDFFAASAQSYLNPVGYLPFYLMVAAGWHSVLVSSVLA